MDKNTIMKLEDIKIIIDIIKICFIILCTYYTALKLTNLIKREKSKDILMQITIMTGVSLISKVIKEILGFSYCIIFKNNNSVKIGY